MSPTLAAQFDVGPNLVGLLAPLVAALVLWVQGRKAATAARSVAEQFGNNGGSTLRDAVDRIEKNVASTDARLGQIIERVGVLEHPAPIAPQEGPQQ